MKRQEKMQSVNKLIIPIRDGVKMDEQHFSIPDSARVLGVSERTIFRLIEKKIIKPTKKRNKVTISKNELLKYKVYENLS